MQQNVGPHTQMVSDAYKTLEQVFSLFAAIGWGIYVR